MTEQTRRMRWVCVIGLLLVPSCSFIGVDRPGRVGPACTTSRTLPVLDTLGTLGLIGLEVAGAAALAAAGPGAGASGHSSDGVLIVAGVAAVVVTGSSAVYGYVTTSHCDNFEFDLKAAAAREEVERQRERQRERERADPARQQVLPRVTTLHRAARVFAQTAERDRLRDPDRFRQPDADYCAKVKAIAARIRELDAVYYEAEVAHDAELWECLAAQ